jgi:alcohol dehydrogenase (cytochrome c)
VTSAALGGALAVAVAAPAFGLPVTQSRLENADREPHNWLIGFQNYSSHRYSRLREINKDNVHNLKVAFTVPMSDVLLSKGDADFEQHPLVDDGLMYIDSGLGLIWKLDLRAGNYATVVWKADAAVSPDENERTRGMAMWDNAVYHNLTDGRVVGVDRDSGEFILDVQIARLDHAKGAAADTPNLEVENFTAAPLAVEGRLLVGQSRGDGGTRGWIAAVDAVTGDEMWRQYTIPGPGEVGHETWADDHGAWKTGGASLWTTGSYDVEQRVTIWGTAQPVPMFDPEFRPGDNLFSNSAMAWDIDTGELKWYFQYVPNESWDYDEQGVHMLIDADFDGEARQTVVHWARNGYFYQLDRTNGDFISATQFVDKINWTAGLDPKTGKPVEYDPNVLMQEYIPETRMLRGEGLNNQPACPDFIGGVRWQPPAYNADTHIAYSVGIDGCYLLEVVPVISLGPDGGIDFEGNGAQFGHVNADWSAIQHFDQHGLVAALDVTTGRVTARLRQTYVNLSGVLATAGGIIVTAGSDGVVTAHNDDTLAELWSFHTGIAIKAPPIAFAVGGKEFIAIIAGAPPGSPGEGVTLGPGAMVYVFTL